jgi:hypothetical protein
MIFMSTASARLNLVDLIETIPCLLLGPWYSSYYFHRLRRFTHGAIERPALCRASLGRDVQLVKTPPQPALCILRMSSLRHVKTSAGAKPAQIAQRTSLTEEASIHSPSLRTIFRMAQR